MRGKGCMSEINCDDVVFESLNGTGLREILGL